MNSEEARDRLAALIVGGNVNLIRHAPDRSRDFDFYKSSGKHNHMTDVDWAHLHIYVEAALRNGSRLECAAIKLADGQFLEPDKAKLGAAITDGVIERGETHETFRFTVHGWKQLLDLASPR